MLVVLAVLGTPSRAGPVLDLLAEHVAARAEEPELRPRDRRALTKLAAKLSAADLPGAGDDFRKLALARRSLRGALSSDETFVGLLDGAFDEAAQTLADAGSGVVQVVVLVDPGKRRDSLQQQSAVAASLRLRYVERRAAGESALGIGRRAAAAYAKCLKRARRAVERQNGAEAAWDVVFQDLDGALLSVWAGDDAVDPSVYVVGAHDGSGQAQFLRLCGEGWVKFPVPFATDLWWVNGVPGAGGPPDSIWACGSEGAVARYDPATGELNDLSVPGVAHTLFGVWGSADDDVWVVGGGQAPGGGAEPVVRRFDGVSWNTPTLPPAAARRVVYKVWGSAADDVWACGSGGLILHFDGTSWTDVPSGTVATLLTLHGQQGGRGVVAAVGGPGVDATITQSEGDGEFAPVALGGGIESLNAVAFDAGGDGWAAGVYGTVLRRERRTWSPVDDAPTPDSLDHHAVAIDGSGGAWFVGGSLTGTLDRGFLVYRGTRRVPTDVYERATLRETVMPLLSPGCATIGCHLAPLANEGLDFYTPGNTRGMTLNVPSNQSPLLRVVPGRPSQSYVWHKLVDTHLSVGGSGSRMPNSLGLTQEELDVVRAWILEGALDD